jgi:hypothetical protein
LSNFIFLNIYFLTEDRSSDLKVSFYVELEWVFDDFCMYGLETLSEELMAELRKEYIVKQAICNDSLREILMTMVP